MAGRREDQGLLTGSTPFVRDMPHDDCAHVVFVRSHVAAGVIERIDASHAERLDGVHAVLVASDLGLAPFSFFTPVPDDVARPPMADGEVRMAGELLAAVVADTAAHAMDAAELVEVDIVAAEPVIDPRAAVRPEAAAVFARPGGNVVMSYDKGRIDDLFELAAHVERGSYPNQRLASAPMESCGAIAHRIGRRIRKLPSHPCLMRFWNEQR